MNNSRQRQDEKQDESAAVGRTRNTECPVIVAGIGAAAGALKSLKHLFAKMPSGHGVAFVIIPHPDAPNENLNVKGLRDLSALPVVEATEGMPILPDRIHVMPPDKFLNINGASLTLHEPIQCDGLWMPIDHFFCSLAADQQRRACGILLSGAVSDGTLGLSEVKAAGGRTLVEDPQGAEFPQMPQSAIDAGVADAVLPAEAMADAVLSFAGRMIADTRNESGDSPEFDSYLREVLDILRAKVGHDFRCYKPTTLVRRIRRRMALGKIPTFADYARFLHENPDEVGLLRKDLLIGVTEFFRQPQAWEVLEQKVIAPLMANAGAGLDKRIWVPGCSTGQEVYTLAMLIAEHIEKSGDKKNVQIFATDSDLAALAVARSGRYSKDQIGENVSPDRLARFFERKDGFYQVVKMIREQVVFAPQNIIADPPFSRMDLISCRNLLIYLDQAVQKKIIDLFHFALREGGFLFLGTAETVGGRDDLFAPVSKKWRIYRRIGVGRPVGIEIPIRPAGESMPMPEKLALPPSPSRVSLASMAQQMLLNRFAPACVMIDRKLQVVYVHGAVEEYLTFPPGELTTRIVDMAREGLRVRLRGGIAKCLEINRPVSVTARVRRGQKSIPVKAIVSPLRYPREGDGLLLITFEDSRSFQVKSRRGTAGESEVHQLEDELKVAREELQSTVEQLEASNDQLKASNEEAMAANEELQSANEEMETSKEELQSLNEELNTINARLQEKVEEMENTNNDIVNLLSSTNIATVFLDKELKVRRYTPASTRFFSLISSDAGRPIADVLRRFNDEALLDDARRVLASLAPLAKEVQAEDGGWFIRRITPYRTQDDRIEGVVVTFVDVCDLKSTEQALRRHEADLETARAKAEWLARFPEENPNPVMRVSGDGTLLYCNPAGARIPGWECKVGECLHQSMLTLVGRAMAEGAQVDQDFHLGGKFYSVWVTPFPGENFANVYARDITERKQAEDEIRQKTLELQQLTETLEQRVQERTAELVKSNEKLQAEMAARLRLVAAVEQAGEGMAIVNPDGLIEYINPAFERISGVGWQEIRGKKYEEFLADEGMQQKFRSAMVRAETWSGHVIRKTGGQSLELDVTFSPIRDGSGAVINYLAVERNVTQEVRLEQHLRQMQKIEALGTLAGGIAHDFNNILSPIFINTELVLLDAPPGSPMRQSLQMVLEAAERGKNLVKQIITFSRQKEQEAKPLKVEPLVKEALKFLRASLPSTVEIREKIQKETGFIVSDPTQIYQVVMNLCSNAAYAMREQGGVLEVGLAEVDVDADMAKRLPDLSPGPYLRLTVSDTGVGMAKEVLERAFDPFFTTKKPSEGSGMGLSVVHGIVRNSKGAISTYSEVGKGSTFIVFFPRVVEAGESSLKVSREPIAMGRERILVVDDEEVQVQSVRNMLERLGYKVAAMTNSMEALSVFRKDPHAFDLVITDQTMPQLTGLRLAEELLRVRPDLPIVLCTGFSEMVDAHEAQALGVRQFLMKPFSLTEMAETIRRALEKK